MKKNAMICVMGVMWFVAVAPIRAEVTIEELMRNTGIVEGPVAMREFPGWAGARKILVRTLGDESAMLREKMLNTEIVFVRSVAEAMEHAPGADAIVGFCDDELLAVAAELVWVQVYSAGVERCLEIESVASARVILTNMQKMSSPVIGEHAIALMLSLARRLPTFAKRMSDGEWLRRSTVVSAMTPIAGKTMLVIGLGGIGTEAARRGASLGMRVIATRNSSREGPDFVDYVGLASELLELASDADVIINSLPLTETTRGILDKDFFAATKKGALFINVGRGATVDTDSLTGAMMSGHLGGAGLDVTDPEPLPADHPLWQLENVIITPHVAGRGGERDRHLALVRENLRRYAAGDRLLNVVDLDRGY